MKDKHFQPETLFLITEISPWIFALSTQRAVKIFGDQESVSAFLNAHPDTLCLDLAAFLGLSSPEQEVYRVWMKWKDKDWLLTLGTHTHLEPLHVKQKWMISDYLQGKCQAIRSLLLTDRHLVLYLAWELWASQDQASFVHSTTL